jgi:CBS domain containing-hemolysin-like protein
VADIAFGSVALVVLFIVNSLLAASRAALVGASRARLRQLVEKGVSGATLALRVADDATPLIATIRLARLANRVRQFSHAA